MSRTCEKRSEMRCIPSRLAHRYKKALDLPLLYPTDFIPIKVTSLKNQYSVAWRPRILICIPRICPSLSPPSALAADALPETIRTPWLLRHKKGNPSRQPETTSFAPFSSRSRHIAHLFRLSSTTDLELHTLVAGLGLSAAATAPLKESISLHFPRNPSTVWLQWSKTSQPWLSVMMNSSLLKTLCLWQKQSSQPPHQRHQRVT